MHVVNCHRGDVVVDYVRDAEYVDAASRHVSRDEHLVAAIPEPAERRLPLALTPIPVDPRHGEACLLDLTRDAIRAALRPDENENGQHVLPTEQAHQQLSLQMLWHRIRLVADRGGRAMRRGDRDADWIPEDAPSKSFDLGGHRRGEQQGLAVLRERTNDAPNVWEKAHIEHPISLVEDENLKVPEVHIAALHVVEEPPGRGDDDVDPAAKRILLWTHSNTAIDSLPSDLPSSTKVMQRLIDLRCELARRCKDEHAGLSRWLAVESLEDRQKKGSRLPGTCLRSPDHISPRKQDRNPFALDRRRRLIAKGLNGSKQDWVQAQLFECLGLFHALCKALGS